MQTVPVTAARQNLFNLIHQAIQRHMPFRITTKAGGAVVLPEGEYENLLETLYLLAQPGFKKSIQKAKKEIKQGHLYSMEAVFGK